MVFSWWWVFRWLRDWLVIFLVVCFVLGIGFDCVIIVGCCVASF